VRSIQPPTIVQAFEPADENSTYDVVLFWVELICHRSPLVFRMALSVMMKTPALMWSLFLGFLLLEADFGLVDSCSSR